MITNILIFLIINSYHASLRNLTVKLCEEIKGTPISYHSEITMSTIMHFGQYCFSVSGEIGILLQTVFLSYFFTNISKYSPTS